MFSVPVHGSESLTAAAPCRGHGHRRVALGAEVEVERPVRADRGGVITDIHDGDQRGGRSESRRQLAQPATGGAASWTA